MPAFRGDAAVTGMADEAPGAKGWQYQKSPKGEEKTCRVSSSHMFDLSSEENPRQQHPFEISWGGSGQKRGLTCLRADDYHWAVVRPRVDITATVASYAATGS